MIENSTKVIGGFYYYTEICGELLYVFDRFVFKSSSKSENCDCDCKLFFNITKFCGYVTTKSLNTKVADEPAQGIERPV